MVRHVYGCTGVWCTSGWMDGWMDRWMDGWMDGWIDGDIRLHTHADRACNMYVYVHAPLGLTVLEARATRACGTLSQTLVVHGSDVSIVGDLGRVSSTGRTRVLRTSLGGRRTELQKQQLSGKHIGKASYEDEAQGHACRSRKAGKHRARRTGDGCPTEPSWQLSPRRGVR